jgi:hypothetical protein
VKPRKTKKILDEATSYTGKKRVKLKESSYYTGQYSGQQAPETTSAYEFSKDSVPTLNKIEKLKNKDNNLGVPQELPFPFQDSVRELADLYLKAQDLRNKARNAASLPFYKGREAKLEAFRKKLNGIMVTCKKLATDLHNFSLAPRP